MPTTMPTATAKRIRYSAPQPYNADHRISAQRRFEQEADRNDTPAFRHTLMTRTQREIYASTGVSYNAQAIIRQRMLATLPLPTDGQWAYIRGTDEKFIISSDGRAMSNRTGGTWKPLRPTADKHGRLTVHIRQHGKRRNAFIHQLVITHFGPPRPSPHHMCRHWDDDKRNNDISNLLWGTAADNIKDAVRNHRSPRLLPISTVRRIFTAEGTKAEIATRFKIPYFTVDNILARRTYADFTHDLISRWTPPQPTLALTTEEVAAIRTASRTGTSDAELAAQYGVSRNTIYRASRGLGPYATMGTPEPIPVRRLIDSIRHLPEPLTKSLIAHGTLYDPGDLSVFDQAPALASITYPDAHRPPA